MRAFETICERVTEHVPQLLRRFTDVTEQEPWIHLPADYRVNFLAEVVSMATRLALRSPDDEELCRRLVHGAARHGENRLEQGLPDAIIFQELYLVREALWLHIKESSGDLESGLAAEAIVRIDMALSIASKASLRGYHRPAFEKRGDWPQMIDQLLDEWAPPPPLGELVHDLEV